jgi:hypothetical protein
MPQGDQAGASHHDVIPHGDDDIDTQDVRHEDVVVVRIALGDQGKKHEPEEKHQKQYPGGSALNEPIFLEVVVFSCRAGNVHVVWYPGLVSRYPSCSLKMSIFITKATCSFK